MARNRMIKVEFWCDKKTNSSPPIVQLLFIGTWNFADDSGVCRADIKYLQSNIFPYASVTNSQIKDALNILIEKKMVFFGIFNDEEYILIKNFLKHQTIKKPSAFRYINADYREVFGKEFPTSGEPVPPKENVNVKGKEKEKILPTSFAESDKSGEKENFSFSSFSASEKEARMQQFRQDLENERKQKSNEKGKAPPAQNAG